MLRQRVGDEAERVDDVPGPGKRLADGETERLDEGWRPRGVRVERGRAEQPPDVAPHRPLAPRAHDVEQQRLLERLEPVAVVEHRRAGRSPRRERHGRAGRLHAPIVPHPAGKRVGAGRTGRRGYGDGKQRHRHDAARRGPVVTAPDVYTFGTTADAAQRLALLADLFAPRTRDLLGRVLPMLPGGRVRHAVDLGCGPGHTTRLLHELTGAARTTGVERSADFLALARSVAAQGIEYVEADVTEPLPVGPADVVHARFLLTHLARPVDALRTWAGALGPGGRLVVHEVAALDSEDPVLHRYYELVAALQRSHGQALDVGARLSELGAAAGLHVEHADVVGWHPDTATMATLHVMNLRTWRHDPFVAGTTDPAELDALDAALVEIARGRESAPVEQSLGEVVLSAPS